MLETLEYGLYVTVIGMGGVFVVLSIIAFFMWSMGRFNSHSLITKKEHKPEVKVDEINDRELFAIITAVYAYHTEQTSIFTVRGSKRWRDTAKMEGVAK